MPKKTHSLKTLLFKTFTAILALILIVITVSISANFSKTVSRMSYDKYDSVFQQSSQQLSMIFYNVSIMAAVLDNSPELISAVNLSLHGSSQYSRLQNESMVQKLLTSASYYSSYVKNIYLYKEGKVFYMHDSYSPLSPATVENQHWFQDILSGDMEQTVISYDSKNYIYARPFQNTLHEAAPGVMIIFLDSSLLKHCLDNVGDEKGTLICALDKNQSLIYTQDIESKNFLTKYRNQLMSSLSGEKIRLNRQTYFLTKETNSFSGWTLVSLVPSGIILQNLWPLYLQILPLFLLILGLSTWLIYVISRAITRPLLPLLQSMKQSSQGDFSFLPYQTRIEEINTLVYGYDDMLRRISQLIVRIQTIEKEKRKTELEILQTQISPHFIYNTLNSIRWLALMQDSPKIAEIISSFSTLLQIASSHPNEFILVKEELQEVSCYLDIMKFRYNAPIQVSWEVEDQTLKLETLKLIIQPLVENCFSHAFSDTGKGGSIWIRSYLEGAYLIFEIEDNGRGFLLEGSSLPRSSGEGHHNIGLSNIQSRLRLWFGDHCGLTIHSTPGQGTLVTLRQPVQYPEKKEGDKP